MILWNQGSGGGGGSSTLSGLTDVDISNPSNGQTLVYNSTSGKWENGAGGGVLMAQIDGQTGAMNMTWQELHDAMLGGNLVYVVKHYTETGYDSNALLLLAEVIVEDGSYIATLADMGESRKEIGEASGGANDYPVFSF